MSASTSSGNARSRERPVSASRPSEMYSGFAGIHSRTANTSPFRVTSELPTTTSRRFCTLNLRDPPWNAFGTVAFTHSRTEGVSKRVCREHQGERRGPWCRAELDPAVHQLGHLPGDRQAEPRARRDGAVEPEEPVEDVRLRFRRDARPVVDDAQPGLASVVCFDNDGDGRPRRRVHERVLDEQAPNLQGALFVAQGGNSTAQVEGELVIDR